MKTTRLKQFYCLTYNVPLKWYYFINSFAYKRAKYVDAVSARFTIHSVQIGVRDKNDNFTEFPGWFTGGKNRKSNRQHGRVRTGCRGSWEIYHLPSRESKRDRTLRREVLEDRRRMWVHITFFSNVPISRGTVNSRPTDRETDRGKSNTTSWRMVLYSVCRSLFLPFSFYPSVLFLLLVLLSYIARVCHKKRKWRSCSIVPRHPRFHLYSNLESADFTSLFIPRTKAPSPSPNSRITFCISRTLCPSFLQLPIKRDFSINLYEISYKLLSKIWRCRSLSLKSLGPDCQIN